MIRVTNAQVGKFLSGYDELEGVEIENERGMRVAELYALLQSKAQAPILRQKSLQKERGKLLNDHGKKDRAGNFEYVNPTEPDENKRLVRMKDAKAFEAAFKKWEEKWDAINETVVEIESEPLADDFFSKPTELTVKQGVRTAFLPFMAKAQAAARPAAVSRKKK